MTSVAQRAQTLRDVGERFSAHAERDGAMYLRVKCVETHKAGACGSDEIPPRYATGMRNMAPAMLNPEPTAGRKSAGGD